MSRKTIAKFCGFVMLAAAACVFTTSCGHVSSQKRRPPEIDATSSQYDKPRVVGEIKSDEITESSGLAASPCQANIFWTHNDSGDGPYIFAIDASGANRGVWKVQNAENEDWEDMAARKDASGQCFLYIAEIGNTEKLERTEHKIYRIAEPAVVAGSDNLTRKTAAVTEPAAAIRFKYSDAGHDAETLIVHPQSSAIYLLTKHRSQPSGVYRISADVTGTGLATAERVGQISVPAIPMGFLTGGSVSPDGRRVMLTDYAAAYELTLPPDSADFDQIWAQKPLAVDLGSRRQGEAITYSADGNSIFATSEKRGSPVIEVRRR